MKSIAQVRFHKHLRYLEKPTQKNKYMISQTQENKKPFTIVKGSHFFKIENLKALFY